MQPIDTATPAETSTKGRRTGRRTPPRVETLPLAADAREAAPAPVETDPEPAAPAVSEDPQVAKLRAAAERRKIQADRAQARLEAAERGEPIPFLGGGKKGEAPAVHSLNGLARTARGLHRALELMRSDEVYKLGLKHLDVIGDGRTALVTVERLRDAAIAEWYAGIETRRNVGLGDSKALQELGLVQDATGAWSLVKPASE